MSGKVKMRCARCGKGFKSAGSKHVLCPDCSAKERQLRATTKTAAATFAPAAAKPAQAPRIVGPGASILVPGAASISVAPTPPEYGDLGARASHATDDAGRSAEHAVAAEHATRPEGQPATTPADAKHEKPRHAKGSGQPQTKPPAPARPPKVRREPPAPFVLTDEQRATIEARYLELAQPVEFDGIRTRIATEMQLPRTAVKRVVSELRARMQLPSWWELQAFTGSDDDLAHIREQYLPLLPVPPVGVHQKIATTLTLDAVQVYQGIRRIRAEMRLPQFNPPELHPATDTSTGETLPAAGQEARAVDIIELSEPDATT